jgi:acyl-CoA thioester hydrolase
MTITEHVMQRRVEFHETDQAGIIHFSNYYKYMDTAVAEFFRALDLPGPITKYWGGTGKDEYDWPYIKTSCDFKKPARFDDLLNIHIWIKKIGNKSMTFEISFEKENVELARGEMLVVCCKTIGGGPRSQEIPREIRERIAVASTYS